MAGLGLHTLGTLTIRPGEFVVGEDFGNRAISLPLLTVGWMLVAAGLVASVVSLVLRLRRARDDERLQLLWIASAAALLALGVVCILAVPRHPGRGGDLAGRPAAAGRPGRRSRLRGRRGAAAPAARDRPDPQPRADVRPGHRSSLRWATSAVVVLVGLAVGGSTEGFWPSLLATVVVALAFQPLRRRVVRVADRLAFGAAAAPYEALADFSRRLGDSPDPAALLPAVADAAGRAVNARSVVVTLHVEAGADNVAAWPPDTEPVGGEARVEVPVVDRGERLGSIEVSDAARPRPASPGEAAAGRPRRPGRAGLPQCPAGGRAVRRGGAARPIVPASWPSPGGG